MNVINTVPQPLVRWNNWINILLLSLGILTSQPIFVGISFLIFTSSAIFKWNPIIAMGKFFLKKEPSSYIPEDKAQLQFNAILATVMLGSALLSWGLNVLIGFYLFATLTALANLGAALGYCIGCTIRYRWMLYQHRKNTIKKGTA